ncbi:MAG: hypothetical protein WA421_08730 [Nitrososphaeraceae archaeon]
MGSKIETQVNVTYSVDANCFLAFAEIVIDFIRNSSLNSKNRKAAKGLEFRLATYIAEWRSRYHHDLHPLSSSLNSITITLFLDPI